MGRKDQLNKLKRLKQNIRRKSGKFIFFKLVFAYSLMIILESCSGIYYSKAKKANSIESYQSYLESFPNSKKANQAKNNLDLLEFNKAKNQNTKDSYAQYLKKYPSGKYRESARKMIDKISINEAKNINTIDAYNQYLQEQPNGLFREIAMRNIDNIEYTEAVKINTINSYGNYIRAYPKGSHIDLALSKIRNFELEYPQSKDVFLMKFGDVNAAKRLIKSNNILATIECFEYAKKESNIELLECLAYYDYNPAVECLLMLSKSGDGTYSIPARKILSNIYEKNDNRRNSAYYRSSILYDISSFSSYNKNTDVTTVSINDWIRLTKSSDVLCRQYACKALGTYKNEQLIPILKSIALNDDYAQVREHAILSIGNFKTDYAIDVLIEIYNKLIHQHKKYFKSLNAVCKSLARIDNERAMKFLISQKNSKLDDRYSNVKPVKEAIIDLTIKNAITYKLETMQFFIENQKMFDGMELVYNEVFEEIAKEIEPAVSNSFFNKCISASFNSDDYKFNEYTNYLLSASLNGLYISNSKTAIDSLCTFIKSGNANKKDVLLLLNEEFYGYRQIQEALINRLKYCIKHTKGAECKKLALSFNKYCNQLDNKFFINEIYTCIEICEDREMQSQLLNSINTIKPDKRAIPFLVELLASNNERKSWKLLRSSGELENWNYLNDETMVFQILAEGNAKLINENTEKVNEVLIESISNNSNKLYCINYFLQKRNPETLRILSKTVKNNVISGNYNFTDIAALVAANHQADINDICVYLRNNGNSMLAQHFLNTMDPQLVEEAESWAKSNNISVYTKKIDYGGIKRGAGKIYY